MTKKERITELEKKLFLLNMKDRWLPIDKENRQKWGLELQELKKEVDK